MGVKKIAIIGGGISGLALLHFIKKIHGPSVEVFLREASPQVGGNIRSLASGEYLFETGPNGFIDNSPATLELIEDIGLKNKLITADPLAKRRYIQVSGRLCLLPSDPWTFIKTPLLRPSEKIKLIAGLFKKNVSKDQSVHAYVSERFCPGVANRLADPFLRGIYGGDIKCLHMAHAFPRMKKGVMTSLRQGMGQVCQRLGERCAQSIAVSSEVKTLEDLDADIIYSTVPAFAAARLTGNQALNDLRYCTVAVVGLAFKRDAFKVLPDGFGYLIPSDQGKNILGVLIESNVYAFRAPQNGFMVRVMLGISGDEQILVQMALNELEATYTLSKPPEFSWVQVWPRAIPQYEMNYPALLQTLGDNHGRVRLGGNYLNGISFNDCIQNAKIIAASLLL